jgi:hypothetical protein
MTKFGDGPADQALAAAWTRFCDALRTAGEQAFKPANPADPLLRADAFRFLTQNLGQAFDLALETKDPAFPQIHPFCTPTRKLGSDCADFTYRQAWISGDHTYRITGKRGTARFFNVTVQGPKPPATASFRPLHEPFGDIPEANILAHQLVTDAKGNFELIIGGPQQGPNWLPTTPGSRKLFIREGFDAWDETPTPLTIERLGMSGPKPLPTAETMIEAMGWAGDFVTGLMRDWPEHAWAFSGGVVDPAFPNRFPPDKSANTADEALIVSFETHPGFWMMTMMGVFMDSMDFLHRPVSYTPARAAVDSDGKIRLIIAHTDPGIANWLDTQGFPEGNLTYRNLLSQQGTLFETQLVKRADLASALPADTAMVTPPERETERLHRYRAVKRRYGI